MASFMDKFKQAMLDKKKKALIKSIKEKQSAQGISGKQIVTANDTVTINAKAQEAIDSVRAKMVELNKRFKGNPSKILEYVKNNGTKVYRIENADTMLSKIHEHTGFLIPLQGAKAMFVNTLIGGKMASGTDAMFIVDADKDIDYYLLLREFYLWYSYKSNLDGFDFKTQEIFKKYMAEKRNPEMSNLDYEKMYTLKEALKRDAEANEFIMELMREKEGGANVLKKMQDGGADV